MKLFIHNYLIMGCHVRQGQDVVVLTTLSVEYRCCRTYVTIRVSQQVPTHTELGRNEKQRVSISAAEQ